MDDLTFTLQTGTVTGFLGPNGGGKTTTLRVLLGLAEPTAGRALVFGRRYRELDQPARLAGAVLESNDFHPARSGRDLGVPRTPSKPFTWTFATVRLCAKMDRGALLPLRGLRSLAPAVPDLRERAGGTGH